ncbi:hypothetical protein [Persephonella atlantica]|nr:hypothetical protein [Persephonella atlantica]
MELFYIAVVIFIMLFMTGLYFVVGYRFIKKHKGKKDGNNKTI